MPNAPKTPHLWGIVAHTGDSNKPADVEGWFRTERLAHFFAEVLRPVRPDWQIEVVERVENEKNEKA
jgi:hypothetical protein